MKKLLGLLFLTGVLVSCEKKEDVGNSVDLIGKWKLVEVLIDPGDGSGSFSKVDSKKMIEFTSNGRVTSNGSICVMSNETNLPGEGTFSLTDSTINAKDCNGFLPYETRFSCKENFLYVYYPCVEACIEKYIKE